MISSISHFKWIGITVAGFVAIETAIGWLAPRPDVVRNNFLEYSFAKPELVQRAFVFEKLQRFGTARPDVLQVGDSSGLHGVMPLVVESYLEGRKFLNMSVASNLGFWGYHALAQRIMDDSGTVKVLVLYFTPGGAVPREGLLNAKDLMAADLQREFVSPFHRLFHIPSLGVRRDVTDRIYYLNGYLSQLDRPLINNPGYFILRNIIEHSGGWARETDIPDDHIDGLFKMTRLHEPTLAALDDAGIVYYYRHTVGMVEAGKKFEWWRLSARSYIDIVLDEYVALTRRHHAKLVVATNPVPESFRTEAFKVGFDMDGISRELRAYARRNPDVSIVDIEYWPDHKFSVYSHIGTPYSVESSHRLGRHLAGVVAGLPPSANGLWYEAPDRVLLDMGDFPSIYGFDDPEAEGSTRFRRLRHGRYEGLAYARVKPDRAQELRIRILNDLSDPVIKQLSVGVYGVRAQRLQDVEENGARFVRFALPETETRRYQGWVELVLSTRGASEWKSNDLYPDATGHQLRIVTMEIVPSTAALSVQ
jgi:hypothetical protein